jgi:hypothetical protein
MLSPPFKGGAPSLCEAGDFHQRILRNLLSVKQKSPSYGGFLFYPIAK